jgi:hypothetical protein
MIIGIAGYKGSGKDTAGSVLIDMFEFQKMSFAAPIKNLVASTFDLSRSMLDGTTPESRDLREQILPHVFNKTPRFLLQVIGTGFRDLIDKDVWVKIVEEKYKNSLSQHVVITDVRFPNEVEMINNHGFVIGIKRKGFNGDAHISERALDDVALPYIINNDGDMTDLKMQMFEFMKNKL